MKKKKNELITHSSDKKKENWKHLKMKKKKGSIQVNEEEKK